MATFTSGSPAPRIGKFKGELLMSAMHHEVLGITGVQKNIPKNNSKTVQYRRYLPFGAAITNFNTINRPVASAAAHELVEGVTPAADTLVPQDITATIKQYGCLYELTDQTADTYEDDVPSEMKDQCAKRISLVREMIRYGVLKAAANVFYAGGSSRATVNSKITLNTLRRISRNLQANHAQKITKILDTTPDVDHKTVEAAYLVFVHSDAEADIRDLPGFIHASEYGTRKTVSAYELGSCENFRFVVSPELAPYLAAGVAVGTTGLMGTGNVDVYPFIVAAEDAWGQLALRGVDSLDPTYIAPGTKDKSDPLGQRGYVGAKFYMNCVILNDGWMAVAEAGVSAL